MIGALVLLATVQLMVVLDTTIVNVALPTIQAKVGFSTSGIAWVVNGYALTFGALLLLGGRSGDLLGRRNVFVAALGAFALASGIGGLASSPMMLIVARVVQGASAAFADASPEEACLSIRSRISRMMRSRSGESRAFKGTLPMTWRMVNTSETGNSGSSSAICFCTGIEIGSGSDAVRTARDRRTSPDPPKMGKYMVAILVSPTFQSMSPTTPIIS